jgi:hypothetical protein
MEPDRPPGRGEPIGMDAGSLLNQLASQSRGRVLVALLGVFAGLCTIFALPATAITAWQEHAQSLWPEATAQIEKCAVVPISFGRHDRFYIDCRLSYRIDEEEFSASVWSRQVPSGTRTGRSTIRIFEQWVSAHPPGTPLTVRYDPANDGKVVAVNTGMPAHGPTTPRNVKTVVVAAFTCAALLAVAAIGWRPAGSRGLPSAFE